MSRLFYPPLSEIAFNNFSITIKNNSMVVLTALTLIIVECYVLKPFVKPRCTVSIYNL